MAYLLNAQQQDYIRDKLYNAIERMKIAEEDMTVPVQVFDFHLNRAAKFATILTALNIEFQ